MNKKHIDFLSAWNSFVHTWTLTFGICSMAATFLCKEFADVTYIVWLTWAVGIPSATFLGVIAFVSTFLKNMIFGVATPTDLQETIKKNERMIQIGWMTGCVAAVAALFSHANPFGVSKDFSLTNIGDFATTAALTFGVYKRQALITFLLFLYFLLWKMPLWSELQPKSITLAGMIMALIFWHAFRSMLILKRR